MSEYSKEDLKFLSRLSHKPISNAKKGLRVDTKTFCQDISPICLDSGRLHLVGYIYPPESIQGEMLDNGMDLRQTIEKLLRIDKRLRGLIFVRIIGLAIVEKKELSAQTRDPVSGKLGIRLQDLPDRIYYLLAERGHDLLGALAEMRSRIHELESLSQAPKELIDLLDGLKHLLMNLKRAKIGFPADFAFSNMIYYEDKKELRLIDLFDLQGGGFQKDLKILKKELMDNFFLYMSKPLRQEAVEYVMPLKKN